MYTLNVNKTSATRNCWAKKATRHRNPTRMKKKVTETPWDKPMPIE